MRRRASIDCSNTSKPSIFTTPSVGGMKPVTIRMVVVFPAPFGPRKPTISPASTLKVIPWTVNDKALIDSLRQMGADGVISDYPDLFTLR